MSLVAVTLGCVPVYQSALLTRCGVPHAFTTRGGGVSLAPFDSLNLGRVAGDDSAAVRENRRLVAEALGFGLETLGWVAQVHGADVADSADAVWGDACESEGPPADALVSTDPTRLVGVRVADCRPVLLAARDGRAVAAVHAGWRGLAGGVLGAAVAALGARGVPPEQLVAAIGPGVGADAYEVGAEVARQFPAHCLRACGERYRLDLALAAEAALHAAGVGALERADLCTVSRPAEFFSYRRDGARSGRQAGLIACAR